MQDAIAEVDLDLQAAALAWHDAWLASVVKDSPANRARVDAAWAAIDDLLDLRNDVIAAEKMVAT